MTNRRAGDTIRYVDVPEALALEEGWMAHVDVAGHDVLVARVDGRFHAVSNWCTHRGGDLSKGILRDTIITCPLHGSQFDIRDGSVVRWTRLPRWIADIIRLLKPAQPLRTFPVKASDERVLIGIENRL